MNRKYEVRNKNLESGKKLRVGVYTRVSTMDQFINGAGIDSQKATILDEIKRNSEKYSYNANKNYYQDGGESGAKEHRPELDRMVRDIDNGEIDIVIVYKIDRLHRKLLALLNFIESISKKGVFIISVKDNIDTLDKMGMIMLQFMGIIGDIERDNIRLRTIDGKLAKARAGYYVGGGKSSFGYDFKKEPGGVKVFINNEEAKVVNRIFDLYVNKNKSLGEISRILENESILTRDNRLKNDVLVDNEKIENFTEKKDIEKGFVKLKIGTKKENDGMWYASSIRKILLNTMYVGHTLYGKTTKVWDVEKYKYVTVENDESKIIKIPCPKILKDKSLFKKAGKLLEKNKNVKKGNSKYAFSGLIKCGLCNYSYNGYKATKNTFNYRCKGGMSGTKIKIKCRNSDISEFKLFRYVWLELERHLSNPKNFEAVILNKDKNKEIVKGLNKRYSEIDKLILGKEKTLENAEIRELEAKNEKQRERYKLIISEKLSEIRELEVEQSDIKTNISQINSVDKRYKDIENFSKSHIESLDNISETKKYELIKKYVIKIIKNPGKIVVHFDFVDGYNGKDWRDGKNGVSKKLKSNIDLITPLDIEMNAAKRARNRIGGNLFGK